MKADLHLHSTASDGTLTPTELVSRAADEGFTLLALTDHDSVEGLPAARKMASERGVELISGVELSCGAQKEIHILGYGFDPENAALLDFCRARRAQREARTAAMAERLAACGHPISLDRVRELAHGVMGRPHVARALVEAGHASSVSDAFDRFLSPGRCAYVPKEDVKVADAVALIAGAGGVSVLAHPMELKMGEMALGALICEWKAQGLAGVEVYHPSAGNNHIPFLLSLARHEGLLVTGGSDFHGESVRQTAIGQGLDRWRTMQEDVRALAAAIAESRKR